MREPGARGAALRKKPDGLIIRRSDYAMAQAFKSPLLGKAELVPLGYAIAVAVYAILSGRLRLPTDA